MDGTKTEYAGLIFVNSQLYSLRRRRAFEYHDQPDVVVKHPTRYKNKQTKKITYPSIQSSTTYGMEA